MRDQQLTKALQTTSICRGILHCHSQLLHANLPLYAKHLILLPLVSLYTSRHCPCSWYAHAWWPILAAAYVSGSGFLRFMSLYAGRYNLAHFASTTMACRTPYVRCHRFHWSALPSRNRSAMLDSTTLALCLFERTGVAHL